jgi:ATP-dependent RNA helicase SUPV3L1/SUV3
MNQAGKTAGSHRITAVLGPTNTGKTYLAVERMLGHRTGMIGFPLRLLARENYDRIVKLKGAAAVALITGEERIIPAHPSYLVCTVESMPLDRSVSFLAVDEVQMAADPERGHVFTDRILQARGDDETMFLGADTIRPLLRKLVPEAEVIRRPRFSTLTYTGPKKLTRLPRRSAVVAFSTTEVYELAELMRRQRGGCAVVMGALSPRTRNAQVEMYQSGEVDYMVATDAIGMGLNMDLDHVAFARMTKFDGRGSRRLTAPEIAQIAGRAGRHMNNGSFGTTAEVGPLEPELVDAVENHRFDPIGTLYWRNTDLDFRSLQGLLQSLDRQPPSPGLIRVRDADDHAALAALARDPEIADLARARDRLRLLWEVCQIPDFRKTLTDSHTRLLSQVYRYLATAPSVLPTDWVAEQISRIDRTEGDIDQLVQRIAYIRTWTYISHRGDWLADAKHWQERSRAVEDKLSDALHHQLTQRFVDRRHAMLSKHLAAARDFVSQVSPEGDVIVEGHAVGRLEGLRFVPERAANSEAQKSLMTSARRALAQELPYRLRRLETADDGAFALNDAGLIAWNGMAIARIVKGDTALQPRIDLLPSELEDGPSRERVRRRLALWLDQFLRARLRPLWRVREASLSGPARGLVFQLVEALGAVPRPMVMSQVNSLSDDERKSVRKLGLRLGRETIWIAGIAGAEATRIKAMLWAVHAGHQITPPPAMQGPSLARERALPDGYYLAVGLRPIGGLAVRFEALERLAVMARSLSQQGPFTATESLRQTIDCTPEDLSSALRAMGYRREETAEGESFSRRLPRAGQKADSAPGEKTAAAPRRKRRRRTKAAADSPFALLRQIRFRP